MNPRVKSPWQKYVEKRAHQNMRLIRMATSRLQRDYQAPSEMPPQAQLGIHLGLITLVNCSDKLIDIRARARWLLHWMLGYLIVQGFTVEDASTDNALDALEAIVIAAAQAKEKQPGQLQWRNGVLMHDDGTPVPNTWTSVYNTAWKFIGALQGRA